MTRRTWRAFGLGAVLACALLAGCATPPTGYERGEARAGYGYTDKEVGPNEYSITVSGNPQTSLDRVAAIGRLRAARLAREKGFEHFLVLHDNRDFLLEHHTVRLSSGFYVIPGPARVYSHDIPTYVLVIRLVSDHSAHPDALHVDEVEGSALRRLGES